MYLEILLEHLADEILAETGLSRANLIYTGGGHAYLLLPHTETTINKLVAITRQLNMWFLQQFDTDLYLAIAWHPCSGNDLMNKGETPDVYQQIFHELSAKLGAKKISRYTPKELLQLNQCCSREAQRECKECKRPADLDKENICSFCANIRKISGELLRTQAYFAVMLRPLPGKGALPLPTLVPSAVYLQVLTENEIREGLKSDALVRFYSKNNQVTGKTMATHIWMGDYHVREDYSVASFAQLAQNSKGVKRIGVLRADIDNLGQAFVSGFLREQEINSAKYLTISRTATLSRSLSMFFKYYLNGILNGAAKLPIARFSLDGTEKDAARQVMIIYSGGDDLFLVGAWNEVIECAIDIQKIFSIYTQNTLTLSAGIGIFDDNYPLLRMAEESGGLEDAAKHIGDHKKNAVAIFGADKIEHTYHWDEFENGVIQEKLRFLQAYLGTKQDAEKTNTAFLYQLLGLLRDADEEINLARYAYALSRRVHKADDKEQQRLFCDKMYGWYLEPCHRKQLITAIYLYVYLYRE